MLKIFKWTTVSFLALSMHALPTIHFPAKIMQYAPQSHRVTVTAYTNSSSCGTGDSNLTASAVRIKPSHYRKLVALSHDLARGYNFGDRFQLWVNKKLYRVTFLDSMSKKHTNKVDLLLPTLQDCRKFGKKSGVLIPLNET